MGYKKACHQFKKLNPNKLKAYVQEHLGAYLEEIGVVFGYSDTATLKAIRWLGITRKQRRNATASKEQMTEHDFKA